MTLFMRLLIIFFLIISLPALTQPYEEKFIDFENVDLLPPMKIPLILSGNFCEMRSNHFHTGLDIKTKGIEGEQLYAVEEGTISRLRVSPWGYGLALYIDHPNGLTSVYAHMQSFSPTIDSLVYEVQKKNESYITDEIVFDRNIKVSRGAFIGLSGNSGSSSAAHLHFEIRETKTEHALNPLLFKCYQKKIRDTTKPTLKGVKVYAVTKKGYMIPGKSNYYIVRFVKGKYVVNNGKPIDVSELVTENTYLAFAFHVIDKLDAAENTCGIHNSLLSKGEEVLHEQKTDYMNFDHSRFINSHQDYFEFKQNKRNIHKNFKTLVNPLPIYPKNGGLIQWEACNGDYNFKAIDAHGNSIQFNFKIQERSETKPAKNPFEESDDYYFPDSVNTLLYDQFQVLMEPGSFYEPIQRIFKIDSAVPYLTTGFQFSESEIPVQKKFDVRIKTPALPEWFPKNKLGVGLISDDGWFSFKGGDYINGWVEVESLGFGTFVLLVDTLAPKITPLDFGNNTSITKYRDLQLTIEDNLAGVWQYKAYINEAWVLMEYNRHKKRYVIPLNQRSIPNLRKGENKLRIYANDQKGNKRERVWTVFY